MWNSNPTWSKPRIQAELRKLGIEVSDSTVWRYRPPRGNPPSQSWRSFLQNHLLGIVAMDFFVVPTVTFRVLHVFIVMSHDRRRILHLNATTSPSALTSSGASGWTSLCSDHDQPALKSATAQPEASPRPTRIGISPVGVHNPILSNDGVSGSPGAVHRLC